MSEQRQRPASQQAAAASAPAEAQAVTAVTAAGVALRGDDIDTDRIMPARFLRAVSFEGLERHVFEDDRNANPRHPFNRLAKNAGVLVVNGNFGCGSSREHAPQGLRRAGIRAIVGESFSEIFQGNAAMIGVPCVAGAHADVERLQTLVEEQPDVEITVDVRTGTVTAGRRSFTATLPPAQREAFLRGQWNPTAMLLDRFEDVRAVAARQPYISGF